MLRLSNTSIRLRLALIFALPVLGMLFFAGVVVVQQTRTLAAMETLQGMTRMAARASALVHTLQKERGLSAGYLGSEGRRFGEALAEQRRHTDQRLQRLRAFIAAADGDAGIPQGVMTALDGLAAQRSAVDTFEVPVGEALAYYTAINDGLLGAIARAPRLAEGAAMANRTTAFVNLLRAKERAGLERAVLANTFSADAFGPGMFERFVGLVAAQRAYLEGFLALADARTEALFEEALNPAVNEPVARLREIARTGGGDGFGVDAGAWFDAATARIEALRTVEQGMVEGLTATAAALRAGARRDLLLGAGGAGMAVLAAGLLAFVALQRMTRRITALQETIAAVERTSDLNLRAGLAGGDEVGRTARAFDRMMEKLREVLRRVAHSSDEVAAAAEQLSAATEQSDRGARRQHQETEQVAAAIHEMASQVEEVVQRSGDAARAARQADEETRNGALTATESIGAIETLVAEVNHSTGTINRLAENSRQVEQVLEVIEGISERTNLLALNAAIEAARAGEHGRGFAVVAEEVRALAGKTQGSIQEIQETIERLRADAGDAVGDMDRARRRAEEGVGQVEAAAESLAAITGEVATISELNEQIAHTIEQQGQVAGQVDASVQAIRRATEEGSQASRESATAAGRLAELAAGLRTAVAEFRT